MRHLLVLPLLLASPVLAAETDWQELVPDVRARLISSDQRDANGRTMVGLEIDMPAHYKTYWHVPGETGIPTVFDLSASRGVGASEVLWPYPSIDTSSGYVDFVYHGPTVLPLEIEADAAGAALTADVMMGICSDICMPVSAEFSLPLDFSSADTGNRLRLRQASVEAPLAWEEAQSPFGPAAIDGPTRALHVALLSHEIDPGSVIVSAPNGVPLFGAPMLEGQTLVFPILGRVEPQDFDDLVLTLTFLTPNGAYSIEQALASPSAQ